MKREFNAMRPGFVGRVAIGVSILATVLAAPFGCKRAKEETPAPVASGLPIPPEAISKAVNPRGERAYSGPVATVRGIVRVTGDAAPAQPEVIRQIPEGCDRAHEVYGRLFREGPGRELGDALVAVTGYDGYVPELREAVEVEAKGCAFSTRTVALTFGQRIEVVAKDRRAYVPDLLGGQTGAQLIALPGGSGSVLFPRSPGRYVLIDNMRIYATAEVLALKYSTFAVTGVDGTFTIRGVPAGPVTVNAFLPATMGSVERKVVLEGGKDAELVLEIPFDAAAYAKRQQATAKPAAPVSSPPPSGSGSVAP